MSDGRVLVVEDDFDISNMLQLYFKSQGYEVYVAPRGGVALEMTRQKMPNVIVLDIMLPDIDGYEVCRQLRTNLRTSHIPIIFLTQKDERSDKIHGLELGADEVIDASTEDVVAATKKLTGSGVDVAVEAVGIEKSFRQCEEAVKGGGVIAVFGTHAKPICLDMIRWEGRSLRMNIMREQPHETPRLLRRCVQLLSSGAVKLKPLLTGVFSLADFEKAFEEAISHPEAHIKIAIVP